MGRKYIKIGWLFLIACWGTALWSQPFAQDKKVVEQPAASVNGSIITIKQVERELEQIRQRAAGQGRHLNDSETGAIKKDLLENLINRELIHQESRRQNISANESEVAEQFSGLKKRFPGDAEFNQMLQQMNITEAEIKSRIRQELELKAFIDKNFSGEISVSEAEVRDFYDRHPDFFKQPEKVHAGHILIKVEPQADSSQKAQARQQLIQIQQKLDAGEDFANLAKTFSQCPSSSRNGDLGNFGRGQMVKAFEDAAFALKPGEVSGIVETHFGYHLIKLYEKKPETMQAIDQVKSKIEHHLKEEKTRREIGKLIENLRQQAVLQKYM